MLRTHHRPLRTRHGLAVTSLALAVAILSAACGSSNPKPAATSSTVAPGTVSLQGKTFDFAISDGSAPVYVQQEEIFKKQAQKLGATVNVYDNHGTAEAMMSNASVMVASKPDVIVEYPSVANATSRVGAIFTRANIPCIAINVPVPGCPLFNFDQRYLANLGAQAMAAQMKQRGWTGKDTTVVVGQALALGPSVSIAGTSYYEALSGLVPGMTPVKASTITDGTTTINGDQGVQADVGVTLNGAYSKIAELLQTIPKSNHLVVYTVSDDPTLGARRAVQNAGRSGNAIFTGYGGDTDALAALRANNGWVTEQMGFFLYWGEFVLAMAAADSQGVRPPALTAPPMVVLTKQNVDSFFTAGTDNLIKMPALPSESAYLYKTGVLQKYGNVAGA